MERRQRQNYQRYKYDPVNKQTKQISKQKTQLVVIQQIPEKWVVPME